ALGARWGLASEASFRAALKGILEESFGVEVINVNEFDDEGTVFGVPDQVEIDSIVRNGELILCELKSSMSKADIYTFERKVDYYQRRHGRTATRKIVISPMVRPEARPVAERLGIEIFGSADEVSAL
uniref:PD-(D/E)XK nuclease family protein n=1 Tax=uncultured Thiohalocapsa sp. TaxID=768990 RepID=UPI0025E8C160